MAAYSSLDPDVYSLRSLPRQPSLESQHHVSPTPRIKRWVKFLAISETPGDDDKNEARLKHAIERHASSNDRTILPTLRQLLRDYKRFKNRPAGGLVDSFRCWTFASSPIHHWGDQETDYADRGCHERILVTDPCDSFSEMLRKLEYPIENHTTDGVTLVAVAATPDTGALNGFFTFSHEVRATMERNIERLHLSPSQMICFVVSDLWHLPTPLVEDDIEVIERGRQRLIALPSQQRPMGNLDPAQYENDRIMLTWHSKAPRFMSDIDVEIWQHYKKLPEREFAHIRLFPATDTENGNRVFSTVSASSDNTIIAGNNTNDIGIGARLFFLFRSMDALHRFSYLRSDSQVYARPRTPSPGKYHASKSEIVFSIFAVFHVMIFESKDFAQGCANELQKMELLGRRNPSVNKLRYLVHLEDCRFGAEESVKHAMSVLIMLGSWIEAQETEQKLWDGGQSFKERMETLRIDLGYLQSELAQTSEDIEEMRRKIREQISLSRGRRDFILALLAAIYLPLSFTTSFFGMNMDTKTSPGPQAFSNWTNSWLEGLPADTLNSTKAIVSTMNTSGPLNWTWEAFGIMLGCLLLTLPLTLAAGGIFRWSVQSAARYVRYWRFLYIVVYVSFFFFSVTGLMFNLPTAGLFMACNIILCLILIFKAWYAWPTRRSFLYIGLFWFTAAFFGISSLVMSVPVMVFPWCLFALIWLRREWQKRKQA